MDYHFISGLPRSGSSLLASILRQNPKFTSNVASPIGYAFNGLHKALSRENESSLFMNDTQRMRILKGVFDGYYAEISGEVAFDNNRRWCAKLPVLSQIFPSGRLICCVRPVSEVIDSVERALRRYPVELSAIIKFEPNTNVYGRVQAYIAPDGLVGFAYNGLRDAYFGPHKDRIILIEYQALATQPAKIMQYLHDWLELPRFKYDFNNIQPLPQADVFDASLGTTALHQVKPKVEYVPRESILPPDIQASLPEPFWRDKNAPVAALWC